MFAIQEIALTHALLAYQLNRCLQHDWLFRYGINRLRRACQPILLAGRRRHHYESHLARLDHRQHDSPEQVRRRVSRFVDEDDVACRTTITEKRELVIVFLKR